MRFVTVAGENKMAKQQGENNCITTAEDVTSVSQGNVSKEKHKDSPVSADIPPPIPLHASPVKHKELHKEAQLNQRIEEGDPVHANIPPPIPSHASPVKHKELNKETQLNQRIEEDSQVSADMPPPIPAHASPVKHKEPQLSQRLEEGGNVHVDIPPLIPSHASPVKHKELHNATQLNQRSEEDESLAEIHSDDKSVAEEEEMLHSSNNNNRGSVEFGELPETPPEEWETSDDRLGGKLYTAVKDFKARYDFEINVKRGELVELTEIDAEDKSWHVRVTLGTSLDGYQYTKRVGWVPADYFEEFTGLDTRNRSTSLVDVSDFTLQDISEDNVPLEDFWTEDMSKLSVADRRLSRSISDVSTAGVVMRENSRRHMSDTGTNRSRDVANSLNRRTGSFLGGSDIHHHYGHRFQASSLHIPVRCSFCNKWCAFHNQNVCEYQCLNCKLVVHKGCHVKILNKCRLFSEEEEERRCHSVYEENEDGRLSVDLPHRFRVHTWKTPSRCNHCGSFIVGIVRQGLKCSECGSNIHHKCKPNVANSCSTKIKDIAEQLHEVKKEKLREKKKSTIGVVTNQVIHIL